MRREDGDIEGQVAGGVEGDLKVDCGLKREQTREGVEGEDDE